MDAAHKAAEEAMTSESCGPMLSLIDLEGTQMIHGGRLVRTVAREADAA